MKRPTLPPLIAARFQALVDIAANPDLRRLQTSWGLFHVAEWAHTVALAVFAYEDGGATAVGIVGLIRLLPAALIAPFASILVDRYERRAVLFYLHLLRGLSRGRTWGNSIPAHELRTAADAGAQPARAYSGQRRAQPA